MIRYICNKLETLQVHNTEPFRAIYNSVYQLLPSSMEAIGLKQLEFLKQALFFKKMKDTIKIELSLTHPLNCLKSDNP